MANHPTDELVNQQTDYEHSDVNARLVFGSIIFLVMLTVCSMGLSVWVYNSLESRQEAAHPTPLPLIELRPTPPAPRLQPNPLDDEFDRRITAEDELDIMREREAELLEDYGWVDEDDGVARIPVERAIEILSGEIEAEEPDR